ncbi:hypothetical protein GCK32_000963 [Trichostrongylus colubriformis]|uniref:Uncharacterized protein n=1 Tax=Trichostrongylus colubriformis TaxID=6319 RepID=A0AAN8IZU1_TRICO
MRFRCAILLATVLYLSTAQECKYIRYETPAEAERRAIFERCLVSCSDSSRDPNPCYNCVVPYKAYGCLLKNEELAGCETDCALQEDVLLFSLCRVRCAQKRRMLKKLRSFKKVHNQ